jgi:MFS transporter, SHS family, lactate transporter
VFGWLAERFGRRPVLMADIILFSIFEFVSGFAPSLTTLLVLRFLFGIAMGGEWGLGASLVMESIPARLRGPVSGLLQSGYPSGYFIASIVYFLLFDTIGWRGMFMVGVAPALLVLLIRIHVKESPVFEAGRGKARANPIAELLRYWKIALYMIVLMAAFNAFSHGTQDLYPTFLQQQHHFGTHLTGTLTAIMNVGAIVGGIGFGIWSERIGRKRTIIIASLLAIPVIPLWAFTATPVLLGLGAFLMQVAVQGAWGIVPVHLNELSPPAARALFPGFAYQLGNLVMSKNGVLQAGFAESHGNNYGLALAIVGGTMALVIVVWTAIGPERKEADFIADARATHE